MLSIAVKGTKEVIKQLEKDAKQTRFAAWKAMNATATKVKKDVDQELRRSFDRPTPFIRRSLRALYAPKGQRKGTGPITAGVGFKDVFDKDGGAVERTLRPHIDGGVRRPKASEKRLRRAGLIANNEWLVPSRTAPLDRFGNIRRGLMQKILSDLRAHTEAGYTANRSKGGARYIIGKVGNTKGIFRVGKNIAGGRWRLVFLIVKAAPTYRKRFDFYGVASRGFRKRIDREFDKAFAQAMRTAK